MTQNNSQKPDPTSTINTKVMRWLLNGCEILLSNKPTKNALYCDGDFIMTNNGEQIRAVTAPGYLHGQGRGFITWNPHTDMFEWLEDDKGLEFDYERTINAIRNFSRPDETIYGTVGKMLTTGAMYWDEAYLRIDPNDPVITMAVRNFDETSPIGYVLLPKTEDKYRNNELFPVEQVAAGYRKRKVIEELMNKYSVEDLEALLAQE